MGLLDRLFGRQSPATDDAVVAPPTEVTPKRVVTIKRSDGSIEERIITSDSSTFDEWAAEMKAKSNAVSEGPHEVTPVQIDEARLKVLDLREVPFGRHRIVGSANYVTDAERPRYGGTTYLLVREPENPHDANAVAVYGRGRKVGHLSAAKAAGLAPILDGLGFDAYRISGTAMVGNSIRLWADIPSVTAMRDFAKGR